jgi:hypothetical protein
VWELWRQGPACENLQYVFTVQLAKPFSSVPTDLLVELRELLREIGNSLATLPDESPAWTSLESSGMQLDLQGWRFQYRVDLKGRRLIVDGAVFRGMQQEP